MAAEPPVPAAGTPASAKANAKPAAKPAAGTAVAKSGIRDNPTVKQFARLVAASPDWLTRAPRPGFMRGVDYYPLPSLLRVIDHTSRQFNKAHGRFPQLIAPELLNDKIYWSKFFRQIKVPETGNKLLTSRFIPASLKGEVSCPEIVWSSTKPRIPRAGEVEDGTYFLKTTHGSDMFRRITYPISEEEAKAIEAEFERNLAKKYGLVSAEWWYNVFTPRLILERSVNPAPMSVAWYFLVIGGEIAMVVPFRKTPRGSQKAYLTPQFELMTDQKAPTLDYVVPSKAAQEKMRKAALAIGGPLHFARVDFMLGEDERVYLNEVTFTPGNGHTARPRDFELRLGRMWNLRKTV